MSIVTCEPMHHFFQERLDACLERRSMTVQPTTGEYLRQLLAGYATTPSEHFWNKPFVYQLADAVHAPQASVRLRQFRQLGDMTLYVSGFFAEHLQRRGVSTDYVARIGERAYQAASDLAQRAFKPLDVEQCTAYAELAERFEDFVGVLDDVREMTSLRTPQDIVRLYDRWRRTGSPTLAERLREEGVFPQADTSRSVH